jgi:hypothetical protein
MAKAPDPKVKLAAVRERRADNERQVRAAAKECRHGGKSPEKTQSNHSNFAD